MALEPVMRTDEHHVDKHGRILAMRKIQEIEAVFLGDSLTRRWEDNADLWEKFFAPYHAANFGVGSDCLENIKWRVLNGELEGIAPRVLLLMGGTNNLGKDSAEAVESGIAEIVAIIRQKLPRTRIVVLGLLPRNDDGTGVPYGRMIGEINRRLALRYARTEIHFRNIGTGLADAAGTVDAAVMPDGIHLNRAGYELVGPRLKAILDELWGN